MGPNVQGNRPAARTVTEGESMCRRVRLTVGLGPILGHELREDKEQVVAILDDATRLPVESGSRWIGMVRKYECSGIPFSGVIKRLGQESERNASPAMRLGHLDFIDEELTRLGREPVDPMGEEKAEHVTGGVSNEKQIRTTIQNRHKVPIGNCLRVESTHHFLSGCDIVSGKRANRDGHGA